MNNNEHRYEVDVRTHVRASFLNSCLFLDMFANT